MNSWDNPEALRGSSGAGFFTQVGYGMLWAALIMAGLAGTSFALYRNDVLFAIAQRTGNEKSYLAWEKRVLGVPGWGTPRSVEPAALATLAPSIDAARAESPAPSAPEPPSAPTPPAALPAAAPAALPPAPSKTEPTLAAALKERPSQHKSKVRERGARRSSYRESSSLAANEEPAPVRSKPVKASKRAPVEDVELEEEEAPAPKKSSRALAKSEPEPALKAEPKAKPEPKTKQSTKVALPPPGDDDNPLKAAIRAAIVADQ